MPQNPKKEKGVSGACFKCGEIMFCNEKEYNGLISLQWQTSDNKAHYTKDGNCKGSVLPTTPNVYTPPQLDNKVVWEKVEDLTDPEEVLLGGLKRMRVLAYKDAKEVHPDMSENSNTFGQIVNAGITHLVNLAKVKAIKDTD